LITHSRPDCDLRTPAGTGHLSAWRHHVAKALAALMVATSVMGPAQAQLAQPSAVRLPSLGESASQDLPVGTERRLGEQIMREARRDPEYLDDPVLLAYLQSVWEPLVKAARQRGNIDADTDSAFAWEPFLVRDRSVNAFALPGGYVGVHLGLIAITTTSDQLASVLAHELTHVTQRHIARGIAPQQQASLVAIAAMILGILAASKSGNVDMANAAIMGGQGAAIQGQLNFSRDVEREADRVGFDLLSTAGYASSGMAAMFEKLDVASRLNDSGGFPYLRSHPLTVDRISEARNRTLLAGNAPAVPTLRHALMQARSRVLMADGAQSLQRFSGNTASAAPVDRMAAIYAGALAASMINEPERAEAQAAQALQMARAASTQEPAAQHDLVLLQAQVRLSRGDPAAALQALDSLPSAAGDRASMLMRAQAALDLRQKDASAAAPVLRASAEALQIWLVDNGNDPIAWELLAATHDALGAKLRAMRAAAEARAALGDLGGAIDRLRAAQNATRAPGGQDFIEASVIDARMRQITALRRQLVLEARGDSRGRGPEEEPPQRQ
jgi:predicted Zn-dependent protease